MAAAAGKEVNLNDISDIRDTPMKSPGNLENEVANIQVEEKGEVFINPPQSTNEIDEELVAKNLEELSDIDGENEEEKAAAKEREDGEGREENTVEVDEKEFDSLDQHRQPSKVVDDITPVAPEEPVIGNKGHVA